MADSTYREHFAGPAGRAPDEGRDGRDLAAMPGSTMASPPRSQRRAPLPPVGACEIYFIPQLEDGEIDVDELEGALRNALLVTKEGTNERKTLLKDSDFRKCVRIYDFLRCASKK